MEKFNKSRHARYLLNLHIVWIPKYRKAVLGPYREALTDILHSIAKDKGWKILAVEVMPDHIHLFGLCATIDIPFRGGKVLQGAIGAETVS